MNGAQNDDAIKTEDISNCINYAEAAWEDWAVAPIAPGL
jgi:hypothetical protein